MRRFIMTAVIAVILFATIAAIPQRQETQEPTYERRIPVNDIPLLTQEEKYRGQETCEITFTDAGGQVWTFEWDYFREHYRQFLWRE